jgi:hypothetical protein
MPAVLLIWGLLIYKFISFSNPELPDTSFSEDISIKPLAIKQIQPVVIKVGYRDPFLGKMYMPVKATAKKRKIAGKAKQEEPVSWPNVVYKGIVSDTKDKKKIFMVIINGQTYLMKEKDTEQEITLKSGNRESIYVKYKGDLTQILIQE